MLQAVERVRARVKKVAAALDTAGIAYRVIGANAVAAWIQKVDPGAARSTANVDLLVNRADLPAIKNAMRGLGFERVDLRRLIMFKDPQESSVRSGVHLFFAGEKVRHSYTVAAPSTAESVRDSQGFVMLDLPALVRMKLPSYRLKDAVHIQDLLSVGLIDERVRTSLPPELAARLAEVEQTMRDEEAH